MKLTPQEKLKATKEHVDGKLTIKEVCEKYKIDPGRIKYYTKLYRAYGEKPFMDSDHLQYTRETKLKMIKRCLAEKKSSQEGFCFMYRTGDLLVANNLSPRLKMYRFSNN